MISQETQQLNTLNDLAAEQCPDRSPNCEQTEAAISAFLAANPLAAQSQQAVQLAAKIRETGAQASDRAATDRSDKIRQRLAALPPPDGPPGLLDRSNALSHLAGTSRPVELVYVGLFLLFLSLRGMPLAAAATGPRAYRRLVAALEEQAMKLAVVERNAELRAQTPASHHESGGDEASAEETTGARHSPAASQEAPSGPG